MKKCVIIACLLPLFSFSQTQMGQDLDGVSSGDQQGRTISLSSNGNIVAIGNSLNTSISPGFGIVQVYQYSGGIWNQMGSNITAKSSDGNIQFGGSVSLSPDGTRVAIGAGSNNGTNHGIVRVFEYSNGNWIQVGRDIIGEAVGDIAATVSLSNHGDIIAIGAIGNDGNGSDSGHVRIYEYSGGSWIQIGADIDGEASGDLFGGSVSISLDGSVVAIGAQYNDGNGTNSGHVRVYENIAGTWTQIGNDIDGEFIGDASGSVSISSDGSVVAIGAEGNDGNGTNSGHVRVYENIAGIWTQIGNDVDGEKAVDEFGESIAISGSGDIIAVGAPFNDSFNGVSNSGNVRIFINNGGSWIQLGIDLKAEGEGDLFGTSVSLSKDGTVIGVGAIYNDGNGENSGHYRMYNISSLLDNNDYATNKSSVNVFPNPTSDEIEVDIPKWMQLIKINLYNYLGQQISSFSSNKLDVKNLSSGNYYLEIITDKGKVSKKIIVN